MKIRKVTAQIDTNGPDITGQNVTMALATTHLIRESDAEFFLAHPDAFTVSPVYTAVEDLIAALILAAGPMSFSGAITQAVEPLTSAGLGTRVANTTVVEQGDGVMHKTILTCTELPLSFGDEAGQGQYAGVKVYDFPLGLICMFGAVINGAVTLSAPAINTWTGRIGLGVEAPTDHQDVANKAGQIMPTVATTIAAAKVATTDAVSVAAALTESGARWRDGTATAIDLFLNLLVTDDIAHDNTIVGSFTGTITVMWANIGTTT